MMGRLINIKPDLLLKIFFIFTISSCQNNSNEKYLNDLGISINQYENFVLILDFGCEPCKENLLNLAVEEWPKKTALICRRKLSFETLQKFEVLLEKDYFFVDALDLAYQYGLTGKNDQVVILSKNHSAKFEFLDHEEYMDILKNEFAEY